MGDNTSCPCHSNVGAASILSNTLGSSTNNLHSSGCSDPSHSHSQSHSHSTHSQAFSSSSVTTDYAFEMAASSVRFGRGVTREVGMDANNLQAKHVAVYTDPILLNLHPAKTVLQSLEDNNVSYSVFSDVRVEPTDSSLKEAIHFAKTNPQIDLFIAVGGGSAMDTAKAANLYSSYPDADFLDFVNAPVGKGIPVPGPVKPLIAVPTTAGTGYVSMYVCM